MSFINTSSTARPVVIGIDHGFGNIKTAHSCFKTGVTAYDREPTFKSNLLVYDGRYYIIGDDHKEFTADKSQDQDYYILTLAAVAVELRFRDLTSARVYLAAGLPLTWVSGQKDSFRAYLLQKDSVDFSFRGVDYHVDFAGAEIYPQGFSAVTDKLRDFRGVNMLCDIGIPHRNCLPGSGSKTPCVCCYFRLFLNQNRLLFIPKESIMTENEKKLLQAKHRLEEAQARNRQKERKARTRRLIQEGAILEKACPQAATMSLTDLEDYLLHQNLGRSG